MMRDTSPARPGIISALWLGIVALLTAIVVPARADVFTYTAQRRQIKACVLVLNTAPNANGGPQNVAPYLFYVMDRRTDVKPGGWEFVNPLAPTTLTQTVRQRWLDRGLTGDPTLNSAQFRLNAPITKNVGAYWEVNLDSVSIDDLQQFDIVYLGFNRAVDFTPEQREKLRRFADAGGTVWLEDLGGVSVGNNTFINQFPVEVGFNGNLTNTGRILANPRHPLVNYPYTLSPVEAALVGNASAGGRHAHLPIFDATSTRSLMPVITLAGSGQRYVSAMEFGAGHIIVSSAGIATGVAAYAGGANVEGGNSGAVSGENIITAQPPDLKIAYNIIAYTSSVPTGSVNPRRTGGVKEQIGNGLGRAWSSLPTNGGGTGSGVVVHKGVAFFVDGNNTLSAYDAAPATDLDGDRNPDDGALDPPASPYDRIWSFGLPKSVRFGTPTIVSLLGPSGLTEYVVVTSTQGTTSAFLAFPRNGNGTLAAATSAVWNVQLGNSSGSNLPANAPAFSPAISEGILFAPVYGAGSDANNPWHIAAIDPATGNNVFGTNLSDSVAPSLLIPNVPGLSDVVGPVVVGSIRDLATNALDKVVYVPVRPTGSLQGNGSIQGVWFSTKNEPLIQQGATNVYSPVGERGRVPWYVPQNGNPDLFPQIHVVTKDPVTGKVIGTTTYRYPGGPFQIAYVGTANQRSMQVTLTTLLNANQTVYADYTVNWPAAPMPGASPAEPTNLEMARFSNLRRYSAYSPDPNNSPAYILGSPAISAQDSLLYNASLGSGDDRTFALREQFNVGASLTGKRAGSGSEVWWMFSPNSPGQYPLPNAQTIQMLPRLVNSDTFAGWLPVNNGTSGHYVSNFRAIGSPAVVDNVAYVVGTAQVNGSPNFSATVIMALNTNPANTFSIGQSLPNDGTAVILRQIDPLRSNGTNTQFIRLTENVNFTLDRPSGTITISNFRSEQDGDTFNAALPVFVTVGSNQGTTPILDAKTGRGPLDNLIWFMIIPQAGNASMPTDLLTMLKGNLGGNGFGSVTPSSGPSVIGSVLHFGTAEGRIASIDISNAGNGAQVSLFNDGTPRLQLQDVLQQPTGANSGATLTQPLIYPPIGTTNTVFAASPGGVAALDNRLTLIADNHRLIQVDYAGNAVWTADASRTLSAVGGILGNSAQVSQTSIPFSRPNVAKHYTLSTFLVADTGNNRVLQMDKGGITLFEMRQVANDLSYLRPNDPLTLNQPTDVQVVTESGTGISITNRLTGVTYTYGGAYLANHYFIADSGNSRLLEVIYAYDSNGAPVIVTSSDPKYPAATLNGQVIFATRSLTEQNANYRYRTVQQFLLPASLNSAPQLYVAATVDNVRIGSADPATQTIGGQNNAGGTGGSLVILKRDFNPIAAQNKDGDTAIVVNSIGIDTNGDGTADIRQAINNPTYFKQFTTQLGNIVQTRYMLCDEGGCYVLSPVGSDLLVEWRLTADQYFAMTGRRLKAVSMQKLTASDYDSVTDRFYPRYLITNSYSGNDNVPEVFGVAPAVRGVVHGEVFEIRSVDYVKGGYGTGNGLYQRNPNDNQLLLFNPGSAIVWMVPKERLPFRNGVGNVSGPIIRAIGSASNATSTFLLEQPTFAERAN